MSVEHPRVMRTGVVGPMPRASMRGGSQHTKLPFESRAHGGPKFAAGGVPPWPPWPLDGGTGLLGAGLDGAGGDLWEHAPANRAARQSPIERRAARPALRESDMAVG